MGRDKLEISFATPLRIELDRVSPPVIGRITIHHQELNLTVSGENMAETIQVGHIGSISVEWKDAQGNPARVDGATDWTSTDENVITVEVAEGNPLIANWHTVGVGSASIQATADADLGEGVKAVTSVTDFTVITGEAVAGVMKVTDLGPGEPS